MKPPFAIAPYPLSRDYLARLELLVGDRVEVLDLAKLRRRRPRRMLSDLRARRGHPCLVVLEDPTSSALLPALEALGLLAGASRLTIVDHDLEHRGVSRLHALAGGMSVLRTSVVLRGRRRVVRRELEGLLQAARISPAPTRRTAVLYLNGNLWFGVKAGGSVGHVAGVVNAMAERGLDVELAAIERSSLLRPDVRFVQLPIPRSFGLPGELNQYAFSRVCADVATTRLRARERALVYQRLSMGSYAGAVASRATGAPLVVEYNGSEAWVARHWGRPLADESLALAAEEAMLRHAHVCVAVSSVLGDELVARGVDRERVVVYPNCVDPDWFDPVQLDEERTRLRARLGFAPADIVATFVGTFGRWHGAETLAQAIRALVDDSPEWLGRARLRFMLVGDGVRMDAVREILGPAGLAATTLTGLVPQDRAPGYLAASDLLLSPHVPNDDGTPFFGSPTKLYEYMAMARGIVASDLDQIGEALRPSLSADSLPTGDPGDVSEVALLTRPGDVDELIAGIRFLSEQPGWRAKLGANARRRVLERYTWRHHVDAILEQVDAVLLFDAGATRR